VRVARQTVQATGVRVATEVRPDEHAHLKTIAADRRVQLAAVIRWAIEEYLAKHGADEGRNGTAS
jgi:hypothetical protein